MFVESRDILWRFLWLLGSVAACGIADSHASVVINELLASNNKTAKDPQGQYDDWIELYNPGDAPIDVGGMYLTDDSAAPTKWQIPTGKASQTTIAANGYLLIWADGQTADSGLHASFKLEPAGETICLFDKDGITPIDSVTFPVQRTDVSYGRDPDNPDQWQYLSGPTPGQKNLLAFLGVVSEVAFSQHRGFYDQPFSLEITAGTADDLIVYTLDGSVPCDAADNFSPTANIYTAPIPITTTTCVRAVGYQYEWLVTPVQTHTYVFVKDVVKQPRNPSGFPTTWAGTTADYEMDPDITNNSTYSPQMKDALLSLPILSIVTNTNDLFGSNGIYANPSSRGPDWERPTSVELIRPDGQAGFQIDCGIQIQGGWFRPLGNTPKKSLRLLFKGIYGQTKLQYPLFGDDAVDEFDTITLRAGANDGYAWNGARYTEQYTRDQFGRDLQRATGNVGSHGTFMHLYLNGLYWGLYNPVERPDASFSASYYGGQKEDWDALHNGGSTEVIEGNLNAWNQMLSLCRSGLSSNDAFQRLQGKNPDGTRNPAYPHLLDVPEYIDYLIVNIWGGNWDWPWKNWYAARDRTANSTGFKFYCWDFENTMGNNLSRSPLNKNSLNNDFSSAGEPHQYLKQNAEYRLLFADHVHKFLFNGGVLTPESLIPRYTDMARVVELAIIGESARWGDQHFHPPLTLQDWYDSDTNYNDGRAGRDWILKYYLPQRTAIVLQQFRSAGLYPSIDAPVFNIDGVYQHGGHVAANAVLSMQSTSDIWYTLDGSDPRAPGAAGATNQVTFVAENAAKKVLVPTAAINDAWRGGAAFDDSAWTSGAGGVGYERSTGYETFFTINVQTLMYNKNGSCYIRIPFTVAAADVGTFSSLILNVRCDDGFIAYINGTEVARKNFTGAPVWNSKASAATADIDAMELLPFDLSASVGKLVAGQNILAIQALNESLTSSDFLMSETLTAAKGAAAGTPSGVSPTAVKYTAPVALSAGTVVKARALSGTTWSALNEAVYAVGPVAQNLRISEIMYHPLDTGNPDDPNTEYIELTNIGSARIDLNLVKFTNGIDFVFPNVELAPQAYTLVVKDIGAFQAKYGNGLPIAGVYTGSLNNAGERIALQDAVGQVIESFDYQDNWYDLTDGRGFSLTVRTAAVADPNGFNDKSLWRPSASIGGSPGTDDSGQVPELGSVVINELMANPGTGKPDWIELYNTTSQAIDIGGWFLSDDGNDLTKYQIAEGTSIAADGYLVFYENQHFGNPSDPGCHTPFALSRSGETVYLHSGSAGVLTGYSEQEKFDATETGVSVGRYNTSTGSYDFVEMSEPTPGAANAAPRSVPL